MTTYEYYGHRPAGLKRKWVHPNRGVLELAARSHHPDKWVTVEVVRTFVDSGAGSVFFTTERVRTIHEAIAQAEAWLASQNAKRWSPPRKRKRPAVQKLPNFRAQP